MNRTIPFLAFIMFIAGICSGYSQSSGDFRSKQSGNWNVNSTWQRYTGSVWVDATWTPTETDGMITVQGGHTVTVTVTVEVDQTVINGTLVINADPVDLDIDDGSGTDLQVNGTIINYGDLDKIDGSAAIVFGSGSLYRHARDGGGIEEASWAMNSECEVTGMTSTDPSTSSYSQSFGNFTWNCAGQTNVANSAGNLTTINGNLRIQSTGSSMFKLSTTVGTTLTIGGGFFQSGGTFYITAGSADNIMIIQGDSLRITGGTLTEDNSSPDYPIVRLASGMHHFEKTGGIISGGVNFDVVSGATLDLGTSVLGDPLYSTGSFTLGSGAALKTKHQQGISTTYATGCIQVTGTKSLSTSANYSFNRNGAQSSGNGFPSTLSGSLWIGDQSSATNLTITNGSVAIYSMLYMNSAGSSIVSGTVSYGTSGTLCYQGSTAQYCTNAEFPSSSGPVGLVINNPAGVHLHANRTINGTLSLSIGSFFIEANTLTLNGAISKTSGSLQGGSSSNIVFGGTGASTNLPAVTLNDMTLNRPNGIGLGGNVTVNGIFSRTSGALTLNGYILSYGATATLRYNGSASQTTMSSEFPASGGPFNLNTDNPAGVNLHTSRTLEGILTLSQGSFAIGSGNTLTLNGAIQVISGQLTGGTGANLVFSGSGPSATLPPVTLNNLEINRSSGILMGGLAHVMGTLFLTDGVLTIGNNILQISGTVSATGGGWSGGTGSTILYTGSGNGSMPSIVNLSKLEVNRPGSIVTMDGYFIISDSIIPTNGTLAIGNSYLEILGYIVQSSGILAGGSQSDLNYGGIGYPAVLPSVALRDLTISRDSPVSMSGNVIVQGTLTLSGNEFQIGSNTLTLEGSEVYIGGTLSGGTNSSLVFAGPGSSGQLGEITLNSLTLNRASGLQITDDVSVNGVFSLMNGSLTRNGYLFYGPAATLRYAGGSPQTTSSEEFPQSDGPFSLSIANPAGVNMSDDHTVTGSLELLIGTFSIGPQTLTLNGPVIPVFGSLVGGSSSHMIIGGSGGPVSIPGVELSTLNVDRPEGTSLNGDLVVYDTLSLLNGLFMVGGYTLSILGSPISGFPSNMVTKSTSGLTFGGISDGVEIPASVGQIATLTVSNPSGVAMISGFLDCGEWQLTGPGDLTVDAGARLGIGHPEGVTGNFPISGHISIDSDSDFEFNGTVDQNTNFLPTSTPETIRNLIINNLPGATVILVDDMNATGYLHVLTGSGFRISPSRSLTVEGETVVF